MVRVEFQIGGRRVQPTALRNRLQRAVLEAIERSIRDRVRAPRCSGHASAIVVMGQGPTFDDLSFELSGCCPEGVEQAKQRLET
jgi:hypothetical protein